MNNNLKVKIEISNRKFFKVIPYIIKSKISQNLIKDKNKPNKISFWIIIK